MREHLATLVADFLDHTHEIAVVEHRGNRRYATTYGELASLAGRFSAELAHRNIAPGDRVMLWGENSAAWVAAFFGCLLRGVLAVPLDSVGSPAFATRVLAETTPRLLVTDAAHLQTLATTTTDTPTLLFSQLAATLPAAPLYTPDLTVTRDTPFQIVFTSGTTSDPKGIVHTHRNVLSSLSPIEHEMQRYLKYERWVHPLRFLHSLPLSHVFGQFMGLWIPALLGAELHFSDNADPSRTLTLLRRERISVLVAVPRLLELLRTHLLRQFPGLAQELDRANDLRAWQRWWRFRRVHRALGLKFWAAISGGATLPAELEAFWNGLGLALIQGYGLTETAALVTLNHPFQIGRGTIGRALPGREIKLGEGGEILVRGEMLARSTWTHGQLQPRHGEWLATGDLATEDATGQLRFAGRKGDLIVTSAGLNIHPADLESALAQQQGVRAAAAAAIDIGNGPEPAAAVLFSGPEDALQAAIAAANRELAGYQQIRRAYRWPDAAFPYTSSGKLLRRQIQAWLQAQVSGTQTPDRPATHDSLAQIVSEITHEPAPADDARLQLDSLGRVQLQSALEARFGVELDEDALTRANTLTDLRRLLAQEAPAQPTSASAIAPAPTVLRREDYYPRWTWNPLLAAARAVFTELVSRPLIRLLAKPRVCRRSAPIPARPVLIIANHVTAYDGPLIQYALPGPFRRRMAIAMSGEMLVDLRRGRNQGSRLRNLLAPLGYWLVTALYNVFPLPRLRGFRQSFAHAGELLDRGYSVLVFPEGTRSPDGRLAPFRPGIGLLAQQSRVPVLPVALAGLGAMKLGQARWLRSGRLEMRVGEVIPFDEAATAAQRTAQFQQTLTKLLTETSSS